MRWLQCVELRTPPVVKVFDWSDNMKAPQKYDSSDKIIIPGFWVVWSKKQKVFDFPHIPNQEEGQEFLSAFGVNTFGSLMWGSPWKWERECENKLKAFQNSRKCMIDCSLARTYEQPTWISFRRFLKDSDLLTSRKLSTLKNLKIGITNMALFSRWFGERNAPSKSKTSAKSSPSSNHDATQTSPMRLGKITEDSALHASSIPISSLGLGAAEDTVRSSRVKSSPQSKGKDPSPRLTGKQSEDLSAMGFSLGPPEPTEQSIPQSADCTCHGDVAQKSPKL